jgi:hypothetical protein
MYYVNSREFFEISIGPQFENTLRARLLCLQDFFKKCAVFPLALLGKACKTFFRFVGVCFSSLLVLITLGGFASARELFVDRVAILAKDLADWILLPLALIFSFLRLILAILVHPNIY